MPWAMDAAARLFLLPSVFKMCKGYEVCYTTTKSVLFTRWYYIDVCVTDQAGIETCKMQTVQVRSLPHVSLKQSMNPSVA